MPNIKIFCVTIFILQISLAFPLVLGIMGIAGMTIAGENSAFYIALVIISITMCAFLGVLESVILQINKNLIEAKKENTRLKKSIELIQDSLNSKEVLI